ncbi:MAG: 5-formyltetrahydrofolate cyclo-ligase [Geminicoccaceae bacterium]
MNADSDLIAQDKKRLRLRAGRQRDTISLATASLAAEKLTHWIDALLAVTPKPVVAAGYWPLRSEIDPRPLMAALATKGANVGLPRMEGSEAPLSFHDLQPDMELVAGAFGVYEPLPSADPLTPNLILAPLLAFDRSGGRLGYGKGFYDRTLFRLNRAGDPLLVIGLAFASQEVDQVPRSPTDYLLDGVLTEKGLVLFSPARALP